MQELARIRPERSANDIALRIRQKRTPVHGNRGPVTASIESRILYIPAKNGAEQRFAEGVGRYLASKGIDPVIVDGIQIAIVESLLNNMEHAHGYNDAEMTKATLYYIDGPDCYFSLSFDSGYPFDTGELNNNPIHPEPGCRVGKRKKGTALIHALMDDIAYSTDGQEIYMCKDVTGKHKEDPEPHSIVPHTKAA